MKITQPAAGYQIGLKGLDPIASRLWESARPADIMTTCLYARKYYLEL